MSDYGFGEITPQCEDGDCDECTGVTIWAEGEYLDEGDCEHECHKEEEQ